MNKISVSLIGFLCLSCFTLFAEVTVYGDLRTDLMGRSIDRSWTRTFVREDFNKSETYPVPDDSGIETLLVLDAAVADWLEKNVTEGTVFSEGEHVLIAYSIPETRMYRYMDKTRGIDVSFSLKRPSSAVFDQIAQTYEYSEYWNNIVRTHYSENYTVNVFTYENVTNSESKTFSFDEAVIAASIIADDDQWLWGIHNGCGILAAVKKEYETSRASSAGPLKGPEKSSTVEMASETAMEEIPRPVKIELKEPETAVSMMAEKQPSPEDEMVSEPEPVAEPVEEMTSVVEEPMEEMVSAVEETKAVEPVKTRTEAVIPVTATVVESMNRNAVAEYVLSEKDNHADRDGILAPYGCSDFTIWAWKEFESSGIRSEVIIIEVPQSDHYHAVCAYETEEEIWHYIDSDGYGDYSAELWQNIPFKIYNPDVPYDVLDVKTSLDKNEDVMFLEFMDMWK